MSILTWLSRAERDPQALAQNGASVSLAIEMAVLGIDARLRLVSDYAARLAPAVERAWAHCAALAAAIPGPIDLTPDAWSRAQEARALFSQQAELEDLLGRSLELAAFAQSMSIAATDDIFAAISVVRTEQTVIGWINDGGVTRKDAAQRTVSFSRHRLLAPSLNQAQLRREIEWRAFEHLVIEAMAALFPRVEAGPAAGRAQALLRERLSLLQANRAGLEALHRPPLADENVFQAQRQRLIENGRELAELQQRSGSLEDSLQRVAEILARPSEFIQFTTIEDRLTALNVMARDEEELAVQVRLARIVVRGEPERARTTAVVRIARGQCRAQGMDLAGADRWL